MEKEISIGRISSMVVAVFLILAQEEIYLTTMQAVDILFKGCDRVIKTRVELTDDEHEKVSSGLQRTDIQKTYDFFFGFKNHEVVLTAVITDEIGKYKPITFIVAVDSKNKVKDVLVMVYRESIGSDVKKEWWLDQFRNKTVDDPIKRGNDLVKISGATLSCDAVARGVKKVLAILKQPHLFKLTKYVMGTLCTISVYEEEDKKAKEVVELAFDEIKRWDEVLSNYNEKSELSQLSNGKKVSAEMEFFINNSLRLSEKTDGTFDMTIEPAVRAWGFVDKNYRIPTEEELKKLKSLIDYKAVSLRDGRIILKEGMRLDPGGIGKGIAVDAAAKILNGKGVKKFVIDFGSTILSHNIELLVAIKSPFEEGKVIGVVKLKDMTLSTSGAYERFFQKDGKKYSHILDPKTLRPIEGVASVTVISPTGMESDAFSTAIFVKKEIKWADAMIIFDDKKIDMSGGFKKLFEESK